MVSRAGFWPGERCPSACNRTGRWRYQAEEITVDTAILCDRGRVLLSAGTWPVTCGICHGAGEIQAAAFVSVR